MSEDNTLTVVLVTSHLIEADEYPDGPCVVLTGSKEAVKEAGQHFDTAVSIVPLTYLAAKDAEIARLRERQWRSIETEPPPHSRVVLLGWARWYDQYWEMEVSPASWGSNGAMSWHGKATHWLPLSAESEAGAVIASQGATNA